MVLRFIDGTQAKPGTTILINGEPYTVRSNDISKTGKHGASKCRIEAVGVFVDKKKIVAVPGSERFDVPNIDKKRVQILNMSGDLVTVMDLESYETIDIQFHENIRNVIAPEKYGEMWIVEEKKMLMRVTN